MVSRPQSIIFEPELHFTFACRSFKFLVAFVIPEFLCLPASDMSHSKATDWWCIDHDSFLQKDAESTLPRFKRLIFPQQLVKKVSLIYLFKPIKGEGKLWWTLLQLFSFMLGFYLKISWFYLVQHLSSNRHLRGASCFGKSKSNYSFLFAISTSFKPFLIEP